MERSAVEDMTADGIRNPYMQQNDGRSQCCSSRLRVRYVLHPYIIYYLLVCFVRVVLLGGCFSLNPHASL